MNKNILVIKLVLSVCSLIFMVSGSSFAGVTVDPVTIETSINVDKGLVGSWNVTNTGLKKVDVTVKMEDWLKNGVEPDIWLDIENKEFSVEPKETKEIKYKVNIPIPQNVSGELMAMVFFSGVEEESNVGVSFGVPVYVTIKGTEKIDAEIVDVNAVYSQEHGISGWVLIKNKSNVHLRPYTIINVLNKEGKAVDHFNVQYGWVVQSGKTKRFSFNNKDTKLEPGKYKILITSFYAKIYKMDNKIEREVELEVKGKRKSSRRRGFNRRNR